MPSQSPQNKSITVDVPQYTANQMYLQAAFDIISAMTEVAKQLQSYNDIRYNTLTEMLLNIIIDQNVKSQLLSEREQKIKNIPQTISQREKDLEVHRINIQMFGKWFEHTKKYMSLETKLEIFQTAPDALLTDETSEDQCLID